MIKPRELATEEIARRAHELYVQRGGEHGKDVEDWLRAEREAYQVRPKDWQAADLKHHTGHQDNPRREPFLRQLGDARDHEELSSEGPWSNQGGWHDRTRRNIEGTNRSTNS